MTETENASGIERRVFFALWPPAELAEALIAVIPKDVRGRRMSRDTLHMTLAFLGQVDETQFQDLLRIGASLQFAAFELPVDVLGYWPKNQILWAGCTHKPNALMHLASNLAASLQKAGFRLDAKPFFPHITLMRKATANFESRALRVNTWHVDEVCLVESHLGQGAPRYQVVGRWPAIDELR